MQYDRLPPVTTLAPASLVAYVLQWVCHRHIALHATEITVCPHHASGPAAADHATRFTSALRRDGGLRTTSQRRRSQVLCRGQTRF